MNRYGAGRRLEWKVRKRLEGAGWFVIRSAGSKGPCDLVAFQRDRVLFVRQCKRGRLAKSAWTALVATGGCGTMPSRSVPIPMGSGRLGPGRRNGCSMADEGRIMAPARKPIIVRSGDRGEDLRTLTVRIPSALHQRLKLHAAMSEVLIMDIIAEAVEHYLQQKEQT